MRAEIPVSWFSTGGWFLGHTVGTGNGNVAVRQAQYRAAFDEPSSLAFARDLVAAKVHNSRTMLRRNWRVNGDAEAKNEALVRLKQIVQRVPRARDDRQLLGIEGEAAAIYFACFENMLAAGAKEDMAAFSFSKRNRRPAHRPGECDAVAGLRLVDAGFHDDDLGDRAGPLHGPLPSPAPRPPGTGPRT